MQVQSLGLEDPLEGEMVTHSSILSWRIPWTEEPGGLQSKGLQRVRRHTHIAKWTISYAAKIIVAKMLGGQRCPQPRRFRQNTGHTLDQS